ncbi:hypothetical protein L1887_37190 [Cichorium endivia]|nr:hypothetical protein L1887_37190 [Cichorium endivia]
MDPYAAQTYPPPPSAQIPPSNQDPYIYNQPQPYPYYPPQIPQQQYPNPNPVYQQHPEQEPAPIHPPGVPVQNDPNHVAVYQHGYAQPHFQNDPYYQQQPQQPPLSYPDPGTVYQGQQQWQPQGQTAEYGLTALYPPKCSVTNGQGRSGGRGAFRGGGSSFQGRGRGKGRGGKLTIGEPKPRAMAWCELCRVDCNTLEVLENHRNGKKHKKNLKIQEDLQKLAAKTQESQIPLAPESEEQRNGLKRKAMDVERKAVEAVAKKQKEIVPFICELCHVKCESAPTFDSHLKGKKHVFNLQRFQEQQATLGQAALQALYPALEALYPALLQAVSQNASSSTPLDQQVLQWLQAYLPQTGPAVLPQGPGPVPVPVPATAPVPASDVPAPIPVPAFTASGVPAPAPVPVPASDPTQEGPKEGGEKQGETVKESESKIEEKVGPVSGTGDIDVKGAETETKPEQEGQGQGQEQEQEGK